jgi:hypothetical protein
MSVRTKNVSMMEEFDLATPLAVGAAGFGLPVCNGPAPPTKHSLGHLVGVAQRQQLVLDPESSLVDMLGTSLQNNNSVDPRPIAIDEAGERIRLALKKNSTSWAALNMGSGPSPPLPVTSRQVKCAKC